MTINPNDGTADEAERSLRLGRVRTAMTAAGLDALLAFAPAWRRENVRYFTDARIAGTASFVLLTATESDGVRAFSTRPADLDAMTGRGWVTDAHPLSARSAGSLAEWLQAARPARLGIAHYELLPELLMSQLARALPRTEIVSATGLMDGVRLVKSDWEIARMRRAASVVDAGWAAFVDVLRPGLPEHAIVAAVEAAIKGRGAEDNFMLIASGGDEVRGMTAPTPRVLQAGDMVRTELTPQLDGYWLQICRSAVARPGQRRPARSFDLFNEAVEAGIAAVRPGVTAHEVARARERRVPRARARRVLHQPVHPGAGPRARSAHRRDPDHRGRTRPNCPRTRSVIIHPNTYTPLAGYHVLGDPVRVTRQGAEVLISTERKLFEGAVR